MTAAGMDMSVEQTNNVIADEMSPVVRNKRGYTGKKVPGRRQTPEHYARSVAASARTRRTAAIEKLLQETRPLLPEQRARLIAAAEGIPVLDSSTEMWPQPIYLGAATSEGAGDRAEPALTTLSSVV